MSAIRFQFSANERLKREQDIQTLFQIGKAFSSFPIKCIWLLLPRVEPVTPVKIGFSVPKKRIAKASNRNYIKRRLKEAWRLNKHELYSIVPANQQIHLFMVYTGPLNPDYEEILRSIRHIIAIFHQSLQSNVNV